ncbi:MAG: restriction endonuclease subunit S, partial [Candidatus Thermoplasmatota archaeon]|nr:restriction endonuclease subunit S [Candidatus Thermoplasmatota archaeon]
FKVNPGDVLMTMMGTIGRVAIVPDDIGDAIISSHLLKIEREERAISSNYLKMYLLSSLAQKQMEKKSRGVVMKGLNTGIIKSLSLPLPPLAEQQRIVAKIDTLFEEVRGARDALGPVPVLLSRFRQSVLAKAFRGELVAQDPGDEPASVLLERIREERKKMLGKKYKEPESVDAAGLPELPEGWEWCRMDSVCSKAQDGTHFSPPNTPDGDYMYITAKNIKPWGIDLSNISYVTEEVHTQIYARCNPEKGDVIYIKDGATTGLAVVNEFEEPFSMLSSLALLKPMNGFCIPQYIKHYLNSPSTFERMTGKMTGTAIKRIILARIREAPIPLPPLAEQKRIVAKIEQLFALADTIEQDVDLAKKQINNMEQSILAKAFRGELVPQDPRDEPAGVLLERIRKKGEAGAGKGKKRGRR